MTAEPLLHRLREWGIERVYGGPNIPSETAALMASGHAKLTGGIGVCIAAPSRHLAAGLEDARIDRQPVVAIVESPVPGFECTDHVDLALRLARDRRIPVCLLPQGNHRYSNVLPTAVAHVFPHPDDLERAARLLDAGRRITLLVGQGARHAGDVLLRLADALGAAVVKTPRGWDAVPDDLPFVAGPEILAHSDTVLVIGAGLREMPRRTRVVQIDLEPSLDRPVDALLVGDCAYTVRVLLPLLTPKRNQWWRDRIQLPPNGFPLPEGAIVTCDSGDPTSLRLRAGMKCLLGVEGAAIPFALAARHVHPDRPIVAFARDGPMLLQDLRLMARLQASVSVIAESDFDLTAFADLLGLPSGVFSPVLT